MLPSVTFIFIKGSDSSWCSAIKFRSDTLTSFCNPIACAHQGHLLGPATISWYPGLTYRFGSEICWLAERIRIREKSFRIHDHCCGSASLWGGSGSYLSLWCGAWSSPGSLHSFQIKCSNRLIFYIGLSFAYFFTLPLFFIYFYINRADIQYLWILLVEHHSCFPPCFRSVEGLSGVPSWDSTSGLPYSKPTRYYLSHGAP